MAGTGRTRRRVAWVAPGDGADHITALPLELRARIASCLPFRQVAQLSTLSGPWCRIHRHTPVVELKLDEWGSAAGIPNEEVLTRLELALLRRGQEGSGSKVDTLSITHGMDPHIRGHAGLIIALADARKICVTVPRPRGRPPPLNVWAVDLFPAARDLKVVASSHPAPSVSGPGAATLETLHLTADLHKWPCLLSLRSLTLDEVSVVAPFPPGAWCPRLEDLRILNSVIELARVDIRLPLLKTLTMDNAYILRPGDITVDAPELEELHVNCWPGIAPVLFYRSFTLRAPRLRSLMWAEQFAQRVDVDVGRPGTVTSGRIRFTWDAKFPDCPEMKEFRAQMMRMLGGLLPELPRDRIAAAARPYITHDKYTSLVGVVSNGATELIPVPGEKLTCDLSALMSERN